jgi:hypothetical protein
MRAHSLALLVLLVGCLAGPVAREEALLPALRAAVAGVSVDVSQGISALPLGAQPAASDIAGVFFVAFNSDPMPADTYLLWPPVFQLCESGIVARVAAAEITPGVAESLRERSRLFGEGLRKYLLGRDAR